MLQTRCHGHPWLWRTRACWRAKRKVARLNQALYATNGLITSAFDTREIMQILVERAATAVKADSRLVALRHGDEWVAECG